MTADAVDDGKRRDEHPVATVPAPHGSLARTGAKWPKGRPAGRLPDIPGAWGAGEVVPVRAAVRGIRGVDPAAEGGLGPRLRNSEDAPDGPSRSAEDRCTPCGAGRTDRFRFPRPVTPDGEGRTTADVGGARPSPYAFTHGSA
jgi:hypothetical protein